MGGLNSYLRDLPPLAWCVRGVLPARGLAAIAGPSASGKSFLAFDLAAAIALGVRWFGQRVAAAPVVYAALEGEAGFKLRAQAWEVSRGRALPDGLRMMLQPFKLTDPQDVRDLAAVVPAGAVVVLTMPDCRVSGCCGRPIWRNENTTNCGCICVFPCFETICLVVDLNNFV